MNKKISQFEVTTSFEENDILTLVQNKTNKIIHKDDFETSLSNTFATNERVDEIEESVDDLNTKVDNNYTDLSNKIIEGDTNVTNNLSSNINSYYDVLNNKIITLEDKHDKDLNEVNDTVQGWIDTIDDKSTKDQLQDLINRLIADENIITSLADLIANGGGSGTAPGFHTQPTSTIFPLSGYYKGTNSDPLATTDTLNQALAKLENQISNISNNSGSLPLIKIGQTTAPSDKTIYTSGKVKEDYLRKDGDTATGYTKFLSGIQGGAQFREGWDGVGASLWPRNNKWKLEVDDLFVRGNMTVNELTVNEIKAVGGDILVTVADMECVEVQDVGDGWKCFFDDADGTKYNQFQVRDQVICQKFDGKNAKRYWRMVSEVGTNYIVLSKSVCEAGSSYPEVGDKMLLLGHRVEADETTNQQVADRRNAIFISAKGEGSPRIAFYSNIDDFNLLNKDRTILSATNSKFVGTLYQTSATGDVQRVPFWRGTWSPNVTYNYYDQVTYNGSTWIAMKDEVTSVPSEDNDEWQLMVSKGDAGKASDDVAKWVEITGDRLFLFETPDFSGTPTPTNVVLYCNTYGMTNPTYAWTITTSEGTTTFGNSQSQTIPHTFFTERTATVRCTVTNDDGTTYYDETQVAKLANGAEGLDAYYIDLTNGTVCVPFDSSGNTPLIDLTSVYTEVWAYRGIEATEILSITPVVMNGSATVTVNGNKVFLSTLNTVSATIRLNISLSDGVTLSKDWYINKTNNGEDGFDGVDAAYVRVASEQIFYYDLNADGKISPTPSPESITISAFISEIENPTISWYWSLPGTNDWELLDGQNNSTLIVLPNEVYFANNVEAVSFKCSVTSEFGGVIYEDWTTIAKVYVGENADAYVGCLSNVAHTVAANWNGAVDASEFAAATSECDLWHNGVKMNKNDFSITQELISGTGTLTLGSTTKIIQCTSLTSDTAVWRIHFLVNAEDESGNATTKEVYTSDFTVSKTKGGAPGTNEVTIYCMTSSTPSRPTFTYIPSSSGSSSSGYTWYTDPTYSTSYHTWASTGIWDPAYGAGGQIILNNDGYRWTKPIVISGKQGEQGEQGPKGATGEQGLSAYEVFKQQNPGSTLTQAQWANLQFGPGLNYRGIWKPNTEITGNTYGWTANDSGNVRDVVQAPQYNSTTGSYDYTKGDGRYFMWNSFYKGSKLAATSARSPMQSSTTTDGASGKYWVSFGASFESIATGLLLAEKATIAGWDFYEQFICSQSNTMRLDGNTSPINDIHLAIGSNAVSNPGSAAFRVDKTGKVNANNATIKGTITADYGKIGGFNIYDEYLNYYDSSYGQIMLGGDVIPSTSGLGGTGMVRIENKYNAGNSVRPTANYCLNLVSSGTANVKTALIADGDVFVRGGFLAVEEPYKLKGLTGTLEDSMLARRRTYMCSPSNVTTMKLPDSSDIGEFFTSSVYGSNAIDSMVIEMVVMVDGFASGKLVVYGGQDNYYKRAQYLFRSDTKRFHEYKDVTQDNVYLESGSTTIFRYYNRNWYVFKDKWREMA